VILQPFNYAKNMVQQRMPISMNPGHMYRGVGSNMVNMGSCTMLQFAVGGKLKSMVLKGDSRHLSLAEEMTCGIAAGSFSAIVGSPLELIMIQQQRKGHSTMASIKSIANASTITRGFTGAAIREALWTCGYLSIPPVVRRTLMEAYPEVSWRRFSALTVCAPLSNFVAFTKCRPFQITTEHVSLPRFWEVCLPVT
jgi:hypothetical protein